MKVSFIKSGKLVVNFKKNDISNGKKPLFIRTLDDTLEVLYLPGCGGEIRGFYAKETGKMPL